MRQTLLILLTLLLLRAAATAQPVKIYSDDLSITIAENGQITKMSDKQDARNFLAPGQESPILRIRTESGWDAIAKTSYDAEEKILSMNFPASGVVAKIKITGKKTHLVFELIGVEPSGKADAVCWGPYPLTIGKTIGEVIGVVRDGEYAVGLLALNTKTLGGVLKNEEGSEETRGSVAVQQTYGSSLQAYSLDRSGARKITVWGLQYPEMLVKPIPGETVTGSKIALFGCSEKDVLNRIGEIEIAEGLPHPVINGVWIKQSPETGRAYLISDFNESNIDAMLEYTQQAGLMSLYHEGPFKSWGHFILNPVSFPNGNAGMKTCVEKAAQKGIRIGVHTLTTFINTNDPYVTPVPDRRLATTGTSILTEAIGSSVTEIRIESDKYFKNIKPSTLHAIRIGDEIIRFREVTTQSPFTLLDCQRGAFGTKASDHIKGETAAMLLDYPYRTLFPDFELQQEIAGNLGRFFNETGVSHMDFDGHEGCQSTGEGDYAMQAFAERVFLDTKHTLVNGTSRSSHYYWHICHYWNWGEPWYGGFRESQGDYRLENQPLLERNYMPNMLGWFLLSSTTTLEDIEWMMARAAGYKAGFALVASYKNLQKNPNTTELLNNIKLWQEAYRSEIFSGDQIKRLKNPENDFHLEKEPTGWKLYPFNKHIFEHTMQVLQPGQPTSSEWVFENKDEVQPFTFSLTLKGKEGEIVNPWIELDGWFRLELPGQYKAGSSIVCDGVKIKLYNEKGNFNREISLTQAIPVLKKGGHTIRFDCEYPAESNITNRFIVKTRSSPESILKKE
jgi:hypothetical protein